ncbi:adenosylcobinamide-phosphate synthase CbiB [Aneurinibacillus sp. Ricciae_BoGa-3]|uniref:adenosylcobinamide-phosphate synthase CbiB n=1 Tax=Aneurinibacillus sp. Ricciae_BoGa-3 TaxID=3022697 RepID=UPI0023403D36|nr:adenosylcobinamide-phosphate synthase CbiB [Aneurinibacillus sp. Ricciae_BoGa-3]WCK53986.1 adenosylcobinamide-phosphate synthase CbiB [Aneurinibacillus sp. Ricciae_BoGa-3]
MIHAYLLLAAYIIDLIVGDPRFIPHPVIVIGRGITSVEKIIRRLAGEQMFRLAGVLFPLIFVGGSYVLTAVLLKVLAAIHPWLGWAAQAWLISTTIAIKGLAQAGMVIYRHLTKGNLEKARRSLSMVVGRDTDSLDETEVVRGAVETVAENIVDAIISPLFYAAIGGAPLAMAYRAANTLDSMVGYKNERYRHLGWASARFDDLVNYIPARLSAVILVIVACLLKLDWRRSWKIIKRDARLHPSPNSGFTEAGVAGALGIQLGGLNYYQGVASKRAKMGDRLRLMKADDIKKTVAIMHGVGGVFLLICLVCAIFFYRL